MEPARNRDNIFTTISTILENPSFVFAASKYKHGLERAIRIANDVKRRFERWAMSRND